MRLINIGHLGQYSLVLKLILKRALYGLWSLCFGKHFLRTAYSQGNLTEVVAVLFLLQLHDKRNIHLTLVCPGPVKTAGYRNSMVGGGKTFGKSDDLIEQGMSAER